MAESKIKDNNFFMVSGWMLNKLDLKGVALQVFAIIYGFSQDGESSFTGSLQYLCDFTNSSKNTVIKALKELVDKGYIQKSESTINGVRFCTYKANEQVVQKLNRGSAETEPGGSAEIAPGGGAETEPNNKVFYNKSLIDKEIKNVIDLYHTICTSFSKVVAVSPARKKAIKELLKRYGLDDFKQLFTNAENSSFLKGDNDRKWKASFDWLLKEDKFIAVLEGQYVDRGRKEAVPKWMNKPRELDADEQAAIQRMMNEPTDPALSERAEKLRQSLQGGG